MLNLENEYEEFLIKNLSKKFEIFDSQLLYFYLKLRYFIIENKTDILDRQKFFKFILNELFIVDFKFKNVSFNGFNEENNFNNIIDKWEYTLYELDYIDKITNKSINLKECQNIILNIINKEKNLYKKQISNDLYKKEIILYYQLSKLNQLFNIKKIQEIICFDEVNQNFNMIQLEILLERYVETQKLVSNNLVHITETQLEDYLIEHLDLIEIGLQYLSRQYVLDEGRIDILARDKNNILVIIEIKIEEDKRIVWQSIYYPMQMKEKMQEKNIRMLTVMPNYPKYLLDVLNTLNVEKFSYNISVENNKIIDLKLKKL